MNIDESFVWLENNNFHKLTDRWHSSQESRDYVNNTWERTVSPKVNIRLTWNMRNREWEAQLYHNSLYIYLDDHAFIVRKDTPAEAYDLLMQMWEDFKKLAKEAIAEVSYSFLPKEEAE